MQPKYLHNSNTTLLRKTNNKIWQLDMTQFPENIRNLNQIWGWIPSEHL